MLAGGLAFRAQRAGNASILYLASKSSQTSNTLVIAAINADEFYPHPPPNALLKRADPAKPATNPSAPLSIVGLPVKNLLFGFWKGNLWKSYVLKKSLIATKLSGSNKQKRRKLKCCRNGKKELDSEEQISYRRKTQTSTRDIKPHIFASKIWERQDWVALVSQPCWVEVEWSWGWLKLRLIGVEVDWSWGWLKLK